MPKSKQKRPSNSSSDASASTSASPKSSCSSDKDAVTKSKKQSKTRSRSSQECCSCSNSSSGNSPYNPIKACCGSPPPQPPLIYRPDRCCYERVKGPFRNPIPTKYQRCVEKFREKCCATNRTPLICCQPKPMLCCDDIRKYKACCSEVQRLRDERWLEQERKAILQERCRQERMEQQYNCQLQDWERVQGKCQRDRERRKLLLKHILNHRKELKKIKEEARLWRLHQQELMLKKQQEKECAWLQEYTQREDERRWNQEKLRMHQENRLLNAQMAPRDSSNMGCPELEELRRMFVPVEHGPKETFEYYMVEPRPTEEETRASAEEKMRCLLGLRNQYGMHLSASDRGQKRTTVQLSMGPKLSSGERDESRNIITTPGALCSDSGDDCPPNVIIPQCLKPLMQTLSYRVNEIDTPLLTMKAFQCGEDGERSNGKMVPLESGPNFNGNRLYGTIVLPKGKSLSPFYTQPFAVTF